MTAEYRRAYRLKNPDKVAAWNKKYRESHKAQCQAYQKQWASENKHRFVSYTRKRNYGLSQEVYEQMVKDQKGQCLICDIVKPLVVDHDHRTGRVRGLLCHKCNVILGFADDSINRLMSAVSYLRR